MLRANDHQRQLPVGAQAVLGNVKLGAEMGAARLGVAVEAAECRVAEPRAEELLQALHGARRAIARGHEATRVGSGRAPATP